MAEWYYTENEEKRGPVSFEQLQEMTASGSIRSEDLVWCDGMDNWTPGSQIDGLTFPPTPAAPAATPAQAAPTPPTGPPSIPRKPGLADNPSLIWQVLMLAGAGLLLLAFVTPWWSMTQYALDEDADSDEREEYSDARDDYMDDAGDGDWDDWYDDHMSRKKARGMAEDVRDDGKGTARIWGPGTGTGISGFIFVFLILPLALVPMFVPILRPWEWIGRFVVAIFGLILFILFLTWFFGAPSANYKPFMSQGLIIGPYLSFLASICLLTTGIAGGILGLRDFIRGLSARRSTPSVD